MKHTKNLVKTLRTSGLGVSVEHKRVLNLTDSDGPFILSRRQFKELNMAPWGDFVEQAGGITTVRLYDKHSGQTLASGVSRCSTKDRFDRKRGLQMALGRALKTLKNAVLPESVKVSV